MDLALTINGWIDEEVIFAQQLGSRQVFALVERSSLDWDARSLTRLANRISKAGLILAGLHASEAPRSAGGQEDVDLWLAHLAQEAGATGIGLLSFSKALFTKRWHVQNSLAALEAAQTGVKLALPLAVLSGIIRLSGKNPPSLADSLRSLPPSVGLDVPPGMLLRLLQDTALETTPDAREGQAFMERLCLISFELASGAGPFREANREGFDDLLSACLHLHTPTTGYPGLIRLGRLPGWKGDTRDAHQARAYTTGYLRGVLQAILSGEE
jgi:hypothetical protein